MRRDGDGPDPGTVARADLHRIIPVSACQHVRRRGGGCEHAPARFVAPRDDESLQQDMSGAGVGKGEGKRALRDRGAGNLRLACDVVARNEDRQVDPRQDLNHLAGQRRRRQLLNDEPVRRLRRPRGLQHTDANIARLVRADGENFRKGDDRQAGMKIDRTIGQLRPDECPDLKTVLAVTIVGDAEEFGGLVGRQPHGQRHHRHPCGPCGAFGREQQGPSERQDGFQGRCHDQPPGERKTHHAVHGMAMFALPA